MVEKGKTTAPTFECSTDKCGKRHGKSTRQRQFVGNYFDLSNFASS